jgi:hypothetical protein
MPWLTDVLEIPSEWHSKNYCIFLVMRTVTAESRSTPFLRVTLGLCWHRPFFSSTSIAGVFPGNNPHAVLRKLRTTEPASASVYVD